MTTPRGHLATILSLAGIAALGSLAMQLVVPSLPLMTHEFRASPVAVQKVIGIYLLGLAVGQFVAGPMIDRIGRRPILLGGLALFITGSVGAALAPTLPLLLATRRCRLWAGPAGSSPRVCWWAICLLPRRSRHGRQR